MPADLCLAPAAAHIPINHAGLMASVVASGGPPPAFSPSDLSPALWIDPSDASSVTISGSSGAYIGPNGLVLPGSGTNNATIPYIGTYAFDDVDVIVKVTLTDWTPATAMTLCGRFSGAWQFWVDTAGKLNFTLNAIADYTSTVATGVADGTAKWVRATRLRSSGDINFYLSDDGSSWTQLGTTVAGSTAAMPNSGTPAFTVGTTATGTNPMNGTIARTIVKNGIGGTTVIDADFAAATDYVSSFTESALGAPVYVVSSTATSSTASYGYVGPNGLVLANSGANMATRLDTSLVVGTTSLEIIARAAAVDWTPGAIMTLVGKRGGSASDFGFQFKVNAAGNLELARGTSSTTIETLTSTAVPTHTDGTSYWVRVVKNYSTGDCDFYTAADQDTVPSSWTQLGTTVAGSTAAQYNDTNTICIGSGRTLGSEMWLGTIGYARIVVDGTTQFDANFKGAADYCTSFTESSSNAATVTITATNTPANAAGALVSQINDKSGNARHLTQGTAANMPKYWNGLNGYNCLVFDGTNDYLQSGSYTQAQPVTVTAVGRLSTAGATNRQLVGDNVSEPALYQAASGKFSIYAGTVLSEAGSSDTTAHAFSAVYNAGSSTLRKDGVQTASGAAGSGGWSAGVVNYGASAIGGSAWQGLGCEMAVFASALSVGDQQSMESYEKSKWGTP